MSKSIKEIPDSQDAYSKLKPITDAAQTEELKPWSPAVADLLAGYGVDVQRIRDTKAQANLSFPTSIKGHRSMAIGFRYAKRDNTYAEDLFVFVKDVGLTCYYRGTQEKALPEYAGSHHLKIELSEFLPDIQKEIESLKASVTQKDIVPEFHLHLNGKAATHSFEGHVEKNSDKTLVINFIEIGGVRTTIDRQFTKLTHLDNLRTDESVFSKKQPNIKITVNFRTLDGKVYEYRVNAEQQPLAVGGFNVIINESAVISPVAKLSAQEEELISEAKKSGGHIYYMSVDAIPSGWIRIGKKDYHFHDNYIQTNLYIKAFKNLEKLGYVEHVSGRLYVLSDIV